MADDADILVGKFRRRWKINNSGRCRAWLARWRVLHWVVLQRLGVRLWVRVPLFFGVRMRVLTGETVSTGLLAFGYTETALTMLMLELVEPGMTFVDVGAHFGYEAMLASVLVTTSGRVISFEPQSKIARIAKGNLRPFSQTRFVEAAVGDQEGSLVLQDLGLQRSAFVGRSCGEGPAQTVAMVTLAAALRPEERPVHVIKCDVEGGEIAMLRGSLDLLKADQPLLILEAEMPAEDQSRSRIKAYQQLLGPLGYHALLFDFDGALKVGQMGDFEPGHANALFFPPSWRNRLAKRFGEVSLSAHG